MIYLDAAATTFQKPPGVKKAMLHALETMSSPGRGSYPNAQAAEQTLFRCRTLCAELFGASSPENVIFTTNATHALNIAIKSLVKPGARAAVSGYEHNAVTRPLHALGAEVIVADAPLFDQEGMVRAFARALEHEPDAAICTQVSNVFGYVLPLREIAQLCRDADVPLIVDASQGAGVLPLDMRALGAAFAAMPGHKGLYGPQGTGVLLCEHEAQPLIEGGTGSESLIQTMPDFLPDRLEAGTHNMPGIAGLEAGLRFVREATVERILRHEQILLRLLCRQLSEIPGVRVYCAGDASRQTGVLSFTVAGRESFDISEGLAQQGIAARGGLHCAPFAHRTAGTLPDGTVRVSVSAFNYAGEIDAFARSLRALVRR